MPKPTLPKPTLPKPTLPATESLPEADAKAHGEPAALDNNKDARSGAQVSFRINEDGSVTFEHLPPELMGLVAALNPEAVVACELPGGRATHPTSKK